MIQVSHTKIYRLSDYSKHLKSLPAEDKLSRFGYQVTDYVIDQLMLRMAYNPKDHELWYAKIDGEIIGWGHMARADETSWELAVSVDHEHQRKGVANKLMTEMLAWAKFHRVSEVFMHCIDSNKVIQHLATKHKLKTRERGPGERTDSIIVTTPNIFEEVDQRLKEQMEIISEIARLRVKLASLWTSTPTN